jgi:hypothetical protein
MSKKELIEKASDPVGGGQTGVSKSADPVGGTASLPASKSGGESMKKLADITPGQSTEESDSETNTKPTGDNSAKNKASVAMKGSNASSSTGSMREEMLSIFGDDLSEEFKEKATVIFEAAVAAEVGAQRAQLEEEFEAKSVEIEESFNAAVTEMKEELAEKVDEYLNYVVEEWMNQNEVAIESSLRTEITEDFITKLKTVFEESYIEVPESKIDVIDEMANTISELEARLNQVVESNIELTKAVEESVKNEIFADVSEGLALSQTEKFRALAEGVSFDDIESYQKKLGIVKEQYFGQKSAPVVKSLEEDEAVELNEEVKPVTAAGPVSKYVNAIARTVKK